MRARFIDADGRSFFDEIHKHTFDVYLRFAPADLDDSFMLQAGAAREIPRLRREVYRCVCWHVPCGPMACPLNPHGPAFVNGGADRDEVVYVFESVEG